MFLQFIHDLSDRQVEEQLNLPLAWKWFVGLQPEEAAPDHTALCRFRTRLGQYHP
ncbi:MAG: transposase [Candidatus Zipacnadales bacterium]